MKDANAKRCGIELDWSRLLGFDQAARVGEPAARRLHLARVGVKVGGKPALTARSR